MANILERYGIKEVADQKYSPPRGVIFQLKIS